MENEAKPTAVLFFDNGVTGTIGLYGEGVAGFWQVPTITRLSFHKTPKKTTAISPEGLRSLLKSIGQDNLVAYRERPMINPGRWVASMSACRADEVETIILEELGIKFHYVDSKDWQRVILPSSGQKGTTSALLKSESMKIGCRMFPQFEKTIRHHGDADGILGACVLYKKLYNIDIEELK